MPSETIQTIDYLESVACRSAETLQAIIAACDELDDEADASGHTPGYAAGLRAAAAKVKAAVRRGLATMPQGRA